MHGNGRTGTHIWLGGASCWYWACPCMGATDGEATGGRVEPTDLTRLLGTAQGPTTT